MLLTSQSSMRSAGALLAMLSLSACGGLPRGGGIPPSTAMKHTENSPLAAAVRPHVAAHPGQSGFHSLADGREALAARLALADAAQSSIDLQYYIWHDDMAGKVLLERLFRAADRGVRVRLLLDDIGTMTSDSGLLAIDRHPNIEVRMFNPVALRSPRWLGIIADLRRINRRMHNKAFVVDGHIAIVGGRNIGDEYFDASDGMNFVDLDLAVIGPAVAETSDEFDLYWNHKASIPVTTLSRRQPSPEAVARMRQTLLAHEKTAEHSAYAESMRDSEFVARLRNRDVTLLWGKSTIVHDHPDKVTQSAADTSTHLAPRLREVLENTRHELFLVSPYFVPGKKGVELLSDARQRGARVVVITNSLASTDGVPVHSKYRLYRKSLLEAGIELYETKPAPVVSTARRTGSGGTGSSGSSGLHAKTFAFDRRVGFVGSYNLDPRSSRLNTEMGVLYECPEMVRRLPERLERDMTQNTYRVELEGNRIIWVDRAGGREVRHTSEPATTFGKRLKARLLGWLPIEGLL